MILLWVCLINHSREFFGAAASGTAEIAENRNGAQQGELTQFVSVRIYDDCKKQCLMGRKRLQGDCRTTFEELCIL